MKLAIFFAWFLWNKGVDKDRRNGKVHVYLSCDFGMIVDIRIGAGDISAWSHMICLVLKRDHAVFSACCWRKWAKPRLVEDCWPVPGLSLTFRDSSPGPLPSWNVPPPGTVELLAPETTWGRGCLELSLSLITFVTNHLQSVFGIHFEFFSREGSAFPSQVGATQVR